MKAALKKRRIPRDKPPLPDNKVPSPRPYIAIIVEYLYKGIITVMEKIKIGITHGDTNGVGYEVILKAFENPTLLELCTPIIYGSPKVATYHRKAMELGTSFNTVDTADKVTDGKLNMVDVIKEEVKIELGQSTPEGGTAALQSLEAAMTDYKQELFDVLVTAPINKHSIQSDTFSFPGHTEYIQECVGEGEEALMILMNSMVRVALVTTHTPLAKVAESITKENVLKKLRILNQSLKRDFTLTQPRIAVLALNPHAGDQGLIGEEEQQTIIPAMQEAEDEGIICFGPFPADGFFGSAAYMHYDAVLAMYHDQGLTAFKLLAMEDGVNYTAGLPIVRTSPAHGTAYDIAGKGQASPASFIHAVYAAIDIHRNRLAYDEAHEEPLEKLYHDKREDRRNTRPGIE